VKIQVDLFCFVTPCSVAVGYQRFVRPSCLHLDFTQKMESARSSEMLVSNSNTTRRHNLNDIVFNLLNILQETRYGVA